MRINGFEKPHNSMQISTWILFPLLYIQFFTCLSPVLPSLVISIIVSIVFGGTGLVSLYLGYKASVIDPADRLLREATTPASLTPQQEEEEQEVEAETKYCWVCQTRVHEKSMHCKFCDKCVQHFDHHCQWLNTCVGKANYKYFFGTLCALCVFLCINVAVSAYITITYFMQRITRAGPTYDKLTTVYGGGGDVVLIIIILAVLLLVVFFLALILQLLFFHIMLQRNGISTYDYIVKDNALKRERSKKEREVKALRLQVIAERLRNGKCTWGISLARHCPCCDPIRRDIDNGPTSVMFENNGNGRAEAADHVHENDDDDNDDNDEVFSRSLNQTVTSSLPEHEQ